MIQLFNTLGISSDLICQNLFSLQISQKVLLHYLNEIGRNRPLIYDYNSLNAKKLLSDLIINHPKLGIIKTIQLFGLKIALDKITPRELRAMFGNYHQRSWYRLIAQARNTNLPASPSPFSIIRENITNYQPLNLVVFMKEMLNNDKYHTV